MNRGGKFYSYNEVISKIKNTPVKWVRDKFYGNKSAFIEGRYSLAHWRSWYLHASIICLDGENHKLDPISWFRYKRFMKNWELPFEERIE